MCDLFLCLLLLSTFSCAKQDTATQEESLSRTRESQLEEKIKVQEETISDSEAQVEKLEKLLKQLEVLPSDIEKLAKVHIHVPCFWVCMRGCDCARVHVCVYVYVCMSVIHS